MHGLIWRIALDRRRTRHPRVQNDQFDPVRTVPKERKRLIPVICGVDAAAETFEIELQNIAGDGFIVCNQHFCRTLA